MTVNVSYLHKSGLIDVEYEEDTAAAAVLDITVSGETRSRDMLRNCDSKK